MNELPRPGESTTSALVTEAKAQGVILGGLTGVLWLIQIINSLVFQGSLARLGVEPRTISGLWGILFAPFIHVSFAHLIANTVPLIVLGWFVMLRRKRDFFTVSAFAALIGGLGTWLIGPALSVHVGASVLIFGYLGYLLARGAFERRFWSIAGSLVVFFLYGGALFGLVPGTVGVSWQGHLFGLLGGVLAARYLSAPRGTAAAPALTGRRIASAGGPRIEASRDAEAEADAEIEAELSRARAAVKARQVR